MIKKGEIKVDGGKKKQRQMDSRVVGLKRLPNSFLKLYFFHI